MPEILYLANRLPFPLDDGWKRRSFHVLRAAARSAPTALVVLGGHEPELEAGLRDALGTPLRIETAAPMRLRKPRALMRGLLTGESYHSAMQRSHAFAAVVRRLAQRRPRTVVANTFFMAPYSRLVPGAALVIDTHNVDSANLARYTPHLNGAKRWIATRTVPRLEREERAWTRRAAEIWVCSDADEQLLRTLARGASSIVTIPNGVDTAAFTPPSADRVPGRFVFFGRLDYFPNLDAIAHLVRDIMPLVPSSLPCTVRIVGAGDLAPVRALVGHDPRFELVGRVDNIAVEVGRACASLVPLRAGGGTRLKLLESLALETPAITTSIGAEGLLPDIAAGVWLADSATEFAAVMCGLSQSAADAPQRGRAGRSVVVARYDWRSLEDVMAQRLSTRAHT